MLRAVAFQVQDNETDLHCKPYLLSDCKYGYKLNLLTGIQNLGKGTKRYFTHEFPKSTLRDIQSISTISGR